MAPLKFSWSGLRVTDDPKLGRVANALEDSLRIQDELNRLENWTKTNKMNLNKDKSKVLYLGSNNQMHKYRLKNTWLDSSSSQHILRRILTKLECMQLPI